MSKLLLIGLLGQKRVGKDTVANLLHKHFDFDRYAIAGGIKDLAIGGIEALKKEIPWVKKEDLKEFKGVLPWQGEKDEKGRKLLQSIGDWGRVNPNFWTDRLTKEIYNNLTTNWKETNRIVITDIRLAREIVTFKKFTEEWLFGDHKFILCKILRDTGLEDGHVTEQESAKISPLYIDMHVDNNGSLEDLEKLVVNRFYPHIQRRF